MTLAKRPSSALTRRGFLRGLAGVAGAALGLAHTDAPRVGWSKVNCGETRNWFWRVGR